jgi:hypothetical protein
MIRDLVATAVPCVKPAPKDGSDAGLSVAIWPGVSDKKRMPLRASHPADRS